MIFIKYRHTFSWGCEAWQFEELLDKKYIEDLIEQYAREYYWSDKYRGIDWEIIEKPPTDWLQQRIELSNDKIKYHKSRIKRYTKLLRKHDEID